MATSSLVLWQVLTGAYQRLGFEALADEAEVLVRDEALRLRLGEAAQEIEDRLGGDAHIPVTLLADVCRQVRRRSWMSFDRINTVKLPGQWQREQTNARKQVECKLAALSADDRVDQLGKQVS